MFRFSMAKIRAGRNTGSHNINPFGQKLSITKLVYIEVKLGITIIIYSSWLILM